MVSRVYGPIWHLAHDQPLMTRRGRFVKMYAGQHVVPRIALIEMTDLQDGPDRFLQILAFIKQAVWRPASRRWADGEEGLSRARRSRQVLRFGVSSDFAEHDRSAVSVLIVHKIAAAVTVAFFAAENVK